MERYYIKTTAYFHVYSSPYHYGRYSHRISNRYVVIHDNKISDVKLIYPQRYEWGVSNIDMVTFGKTKFRRLVVFGGEHIYPTFSLDDHGMIHEVAVYVDFDVIDENQQYSKITFLRQDAPLIIKSNYNLIPITVRDRTYGRFYIDTIYKNGRAVMLSKLFMSRFRELYDCESYGTVNPRFDYSIIYPSLCACYDEHDESDGIGINDFIDYLIDYRMNHFKKRTNYEPSGNRGPSGYYRYFPELRPAMFEFDGNSKKRFDYVKVEVPLVNPDRGTVKLIDVAREHRIRLYTEVYNKLEEYTGVPKSFFRIDNCMLTRDERLLLVIGIKEVPIQEEEAE